MKVDLRDVIEAIEFENESLTHYYNKENGIISYLESDDTSEYKLSTDLTTLEDWEREIILSKKDILENPQNYIQLPSIEEIDGVSMMIEFLKENISLIKASEIEEADEKSLRELIDRKGLSSRWYDYREDGEKNLAIAWCKRNRIEY